MLWDVAVVCVVPTHLFIAQVGAGCLSSPGTVLSAWGTSMNNSQNSLFCGTLFSDNLLNGWPHRECRYTDSSRHPWILIPCRKFLLCHPRNSLYPHSSLQKCPKYLLLQLNNTFLMYNISSLTSSPEWCPAAGNVQWVNKIHRNLEVTQGDIWKTEDIARKGAKSCCLWGGGPGEEG